MTSAGRAAGVLGLCLAIGALATALGGCSAWRAEREAERQAGRRTAFSRAVLADVRRLTADFNSGDDAKLATHYAPDQELMSPGQPNLHGAAEAAKHRRQENQYHVTLAISAVVIDAAASGDVATVRSICNVTVADRTTGKVLQAQPNNCLLGYRRQPDGALKVDWSLTSPTGPATTPG